MSLSPGIQIGNYEIRSAIGKGGMGEVWEARDTKLGRSVAIKTLPEGFAANEERLARFEREAKLLAALNHPNIASIFGLEDFSGSRFLVMEFIEGETLADILDRGPIPMDQALKLAIQIAEALESAHEKGIVHRDLKPANIKITPDGKVKVLDFGLAKALGEAADVNLSNSPTLSMAATAQGIILGTAAFMSPEQARGMNVDHRTDVWAFGCVLYQMLTGRQAFQGELVSDILASVLAREPDYTQLHPQVHPRLREIVRRCLEKDRKRRWQAIGDVRVEIQQVLADPAGLTIATPAAAQTPQAKLRLVLPWAAAAIVLGALGAWMLKPAPPPDRRPLARFDFELAEGQQFRNTGRNVIAFSPDGRHFAYNVGRGLLLRSLDTMTPRLIAGTEDALTNPFFSPNGEWIGFFVAGELRKIAISGGAPVTLCKAANLFGASWGTDGTILFGQPAGIMRVSADGGEPKLVIRTGENEASFGPQLLPDGDTVLFSLARASGGGTRWDQAQVVAQSLKSGQRKTLVQGGSDARYAPTGHLIYALGNVLFAVPFDFKKLEVVGGAVPIIQGVQRAAVPATNTGAANYGFSDQGALVYLIGLADTQAPDGILTLVDRAGSVRRLNAPAGQYRHPRVSPDGKRVAVETIAQNGQSSIWVYDLAGDTAIRRLTPEGGNNTRPIWTPDSKRIAFGSDREKPQGIYVQPADGSGLPERLTSAEEGTEHFPESWSADGQVLSFAAVRGGFGQSSWSLWTLSKDKGKPELFYDNPASNEFGSNFSPDGKWIAYASNEGADGQFGIYVQPFPRTGVKYQISQSGGAWPVWSPKGSELFYRLNVGVTSAEQKLTGVNITTKPVPAFSNENPLGIRGFLLFTNYRDYDVMPDGRNFLMMFSNQTAARDVTRPRIQIVLNWFEELKARVPRR